MTWNPAGRSDTFNVLALSVVTLPDAHETPTEKLRSPERTIPPTKVRNTVDIMPRISPKVPLGDVPISPEAEHG